MKATSTDLHWMRHALDLAHKGQGRVHPNPLVGCVLVKNGKKIAEGYHTGFGRDHAEVEALKRAGARARGSTAYVNLEPCSHWGKTPPCIDALIRAGVRRVVAAMRDPNPQVAGRGLKRLRVAGISIVNGVLEADAQQLNRAFTTWIRERRPYVTLKAAASLDGKMATVTGESKWITSAPARARGHALRAEADAIAIGIGTALRDNPRLDAHGKGRDPIKVVFDSQLGLSPRARLLRGGARVIVFTSASSSAAKRKVLEKKRASVFVLPTDRSRQLSIPEALSVLGREGIAHLLVEGGSALHRSFLEVGLVDEVLWFTAPMIIGRSKQLKDAWRLKNVQVEKIKEDVCIRGKVI